MIITYSYTPVLEDFSGDGRMTVNAIFKILENAGNFHSDMAGDNLLKGSADGKGKILTDWYTDFTEIPEYGQKITVKTWINSEMSILSATRNFEFYADDKLCGRAAASIVIFDLNLKRPVRLDMSLMGMYNPEPKSVFEDKKMPKVTVPSEFTSEMTLKPRRTDIDYNHHVHNLVYIDYAMEILPEAVYGAHNFKNVRISYKSAIQEGEDVTLKYAETENSHTVCIFGADNTLKTILRLN